MMKINSLIVGAIAAPLSVSHGALLITALADPDGGTGDLLELYATTPIADLSIYGLESISNGGSSAGSAEVALPSVSLSAGDFFYVTGGQTDFTQFYGFAANFVTNVISINGNDSIVLYETGVIADRVLADADLTDIHGDGWIYRNNGEGPNTSYVSSEWTATTNSLGNSNDETNAGSTTPVPVGTYVVPEPSTALLSGMMLLGLLARRR